MPPVRPPAVPSKALARLAVAGISVAVIALGALAVWAAIGSQNQAGGLTKAGLQTSGHLRAVQALAIIDTSTDAQEERIIPAELAKVRAAQRVLHEALHRMENGEVRQARQLAKRAQPMVRRLNPAIEDFLAGPPGYDSDGTTGPEKKMEDILEALQVLLNDLDADPSGLLATKLDSATRSERTVRTTAFVLIPLGLGGVVACAWLLEIYRRRSEATMRSAIDTTALEARTDELTGLSNRRALLEELESRTDRDESLTLVLADLNGFKRYNDTFGHPAGDALLRRLARTLAQACDGLGLAARLGGDEFCVLFDELQPDEARALVEAALSEEGKGFRITAASGVASIPQDAHQPEGALHVADVKMYAAKVSGHPGVEEATSEAMMLMLDEHHPGLGLHVKGVAELAVACAQALGLPGDDVSSVELAAELHDVGKVAIPSAILVKEGPLSPEEWEFMRAHSMIGARVLGAVPSLAHVAPIVRSSHERWDGSGYPDGLAGDAIPIGARITAVADTFYAMTEGRPYAPAQSVESTRRELRSCSGTQFDPDVVTAFLGALDSRDGRDGTHPSPAVALT